MGYLLAVAGYTVVIVPQSSAGQGRVVAGPVAERVAPHGTLAERNCRCKESATRQPRPRLLRLRLAMTIRVMRRQDPRRGNSGLSGSLRRGVPTWAGGRCR